MVVFRTLKFKHYRKAVDLDKQIKAKKADEIAVLEYAADLVVKWDFLDVDTGDAIPVGELDELSPDQIEELLSTFEHGFDRATEVPKKTA